MTGISVTTKHENSGERAHNGIRHCASPLVGFSTTNSTRAGEPTLSWNQLRSNPLNERYRDFTPPSDRPALESGGSREESQRLSGTTVRHWNFDPLERRLPFRVKHRTKPDNCLNDEHAVRSQAKGSGFERRAKRHSFKDELACD